MKQKINNRLMATKRLKILFAGLALLSVNLCLWAAAMHSATEANSLKLVADGQPAATILLSDKPTRAAQLAAYELQHHIRLMTDVTLPIMTEGEEGIEGVCIAVGATKASSVAGLTPDSWQPQEYAVVFKTNTLILAGQDAPNFEPIEYDLNNSMSFKTWPTPYEAQGTMHAVYEFLERGCGVRWFTPTEVGTHIPRYTILEVKMWDIRRSPAFAYRDLGHILNISERYPIETILWKRDSPQAAAWEEKAFAALHKRFPSRWHYIHAKRGQCRLFLYRKRMGGCEQYASNHSFYGYYDRFLDNHPDWFAKGYDHAEKPPQMCYTNPEFIEQVVQDAQDYFDGKGTQPGAVARGDYFAVVPMDNSSYCKCEECRKWIVPDEKKDHFFTKGVYSDYLWQFFNQVADKVSEFHPDKTISALAYASYAYPPTRVNPATNVSVQLCLHVRNVYDTAMQENDRALLDVWTGDSGRPIFLWLYYCFPLERGHRSGSEWHVFPGFFAHTIGEMFKSYHEKQIRGAFFNGWCNDIDAYVTFAMLDNPEHNTDVLLEDYFTTYFGAAAEPMHRFYNLVEETYCDPANYQTNKFGTVGHQTMKMAWNRLGTKERMKSLGDWIAEAESLAQTELEKERVELFKAGIWDYMFAGVYSVDDVMRMEPWADEPGTIEHILHETPMLSESNALSGLVFEAETAGIIFITSQGDKNVAKGKVCSAYTDGELYNTFINGSGELSLRCDLGPVPPEGRQLRRFRLIWSLYDGARRRLSVQLFARDAATGEWRAISNVISDNPSMLSGYGVLTLSFPEDGVKGFDALRLMDFSAKDGRPSTRICEIEAEITAE